MKVIFEKSVEKFVASLEKVTHAKVMRMAELLETFGHDMGMPHSKKIEADLFELRVRGRQEVRIFYTFWRGTAVLLHAFVKKSQRTPYKELRQAKKRLANLS